MKYIQKLNKPIPISRQNNVVFKAKNVDIGIVTEGYSETGPGPENGPENADYTDPFT